MSENVLELFEVDIAVCSDTGATCTRNEDHCGKHRESKTDGLMAVADGMTTTEAGELASQRAVMALLKSYKEIGPGMPQTQRLVRAVRNANYELRETILTVPELRGMSTTLTAVAVSSGKMSAAHVGNGRVYLLRDRQIVQLSKDHTIAGEAEASGVPPTEHDVDRLTRQLGVELVIHVDLFEMELERNDVVVICTDGLHRVLHDEEIAAHAAGDDAWTVCRRLIEVANRRGTPDNLSVGVLRMLGDTPRS
jgi:PPM family protein phosphatase